MRSPGKSLQSDWRFCLIRSLTAYRIWLRRLSVAFDDGPATREAVNPVSKVRDANQRCELIAQAARVSQGIPRRRRSTPISELSARAHSHNREGQQTETGD